MIYELLALVGMLILAVAMSLETRKIRSNQRAIIGVMVYVLMLTEEKASCKNLAKVRADLLRIAKEI